MKYVFLLLLIMLAACSQSVEQELPTQEAQPIQQQVEPDDDYEPIFGDQGSATVKSLDQEDEPESEKVEKETKSLPEYIELLENLEFQATYGLTRSSQSQTLQGTFTQYTQGDNFRIDIDLPGAPFAIYKFGERIVSCNPECAQVTRILQEKIGSTIDISQYQVEQVDDRTLAGLTGTCFTLTQLSTVLEYCFSEQGVPVYVDTINGALRDVLELQSYELSVSQSLLAPPKVD